MYNTKEGKSCVIYIRVSSERQVKGYSLDGQKHYLAECAERRGMAVLDTYVEEGKSGKSIEGRTEFQRMLDDIQSGKVHTDYFAKAQHIILVDGEKLTELMIEYNLGVSAQKTYQIKRIDSDYFSNDSQ